MTIYQMLQENTFAQSAITVLQNATEGSQFENNLYIAGGFVRDELLGKPSKDVDIVVDGPPNAGLEAATFIAKKLGVYREGSNPVIFPQYYTAKLSIPVDGKTMDVEFVAPRREKYTPGSRHPGVEPGTLRDDTMRRDFTLNSLLKNLHTGKILDLSGRGLDDLKNGVLNTTGDPDTIFKDDPLRILRAVRFACKYNFTLPMNVIRSIKRNAASLKNISSERINDEVNKILVLNKPSKAFELFRATGILGVIMPEMQRLVKLKQNAYHNQDAFGHSMSVLDASSPELVKRLGALFHDIGKASTRTEKDGKVQFIGHADVGEGIARNVMKRLKYPNDMIDRVANIVKYHMDLKSAGPEATNLKDSTLRKFIYRVGNNLEDILSVIDADNVSHAEGHSMPNQINIIRKKIANMDVNDILNTKSVLDGNQIAALGAKGKMIGSIKERILLKCLENPGFSVKQAEDLAKNMIRAEKDKQK